MRLGVRFGGFEVGLRCALSACLEPFAIYKGLPSYRAILDREGKATVADVALIGNEERVGEQLAELADAGVTDFAAAVYGAPEERDRAISLLRTVRRPG